MRTPQDMATCIAAYDSPLRIGGVASRLTARELFLRDQCVSRADELAPLGRRGISYVAPDICEVEITGQVAAKRVSEANNRTFGVESW